MKKINKKEAIYQAAVKIFGEKGFGNSSLDEIAQRAGVAKGTIFYYFKTKDALFSALVAEGVNILSAEMSKISSQEIAAKKKMEQVIDYHFLFFKKHSDFCLMLLGQLGNFQKRWLESTILIQEQYLSSLVLLINDAKKEKLISKDMDTKAISISLFSLLTISAMDWAIFHQEIPVFKFKKTISQIVMNGLFIEEKRH